MGEPPLQHKNPDLLVTIGGAYRAHSLAIVPGNEISILDAAVEQMNAPIAGPMQPLSQVTQRQGPAALDVNAEPVVKPTPPVSRRRLTATRVIEMFQALNLPVTDDAQLIEAKANELKPRYRRMKSLPDPHMSAEAEAWFRDLADIQMDLDRLLGVIRDHFEKLLNTALKAAREAGLTTLTPALVEDLQRLAIDECRCDPALAERFLTDYLTASNFVTDDLARRSQAGRARYSVVDIISMFRDVDLPVTDDTMHISTKIKQLVPKYRTMERSENLLEREKAAVWFKTIDVLQGDVSELIERVRDLLFLFADIELYAALSVPSIRPSRVFPSKLAQRAKQDLKCDESLARRLAREYIEQRGIEIDQRLPPYVYELEAFKIEGLPAYNAVLLKKFIVNHVDLQEFCFYLKDRLGRMYGFQALRGEDENGKVRALLERADQNDEVGEVIFELTRYWIEIERSSPKVLKSGAIHQALGVYLRELLERDEHDRVDQVLDLLGRILF
jgi:hypothetical protein